MSSTEGRTSPLRLACLAAAAVVAVTACGSNTTTTGGSTLAQPPTAKTAPITDISGNDPFVDAINLAIESNLKGSGTLESLKTAQQTIEQLLGLSAPSPTPAAKK